MSGSKRQWACFPADDPKTLEKFKLFCNIALLQSFICLKSMLPMKESNLQ